jgi:hypothetical protein
VISNNEINFQSENDFFINGNGNPPTSGVSSLEETGPDARRRRRR